MRDVYIAQKGHDPGFTIRQEEKLPTVFHCYPKPLLRFQDSNSILFREVEDDIMSLFGTVDPYCGSSAHKLVRPIYQDPVPDLNQERIFTEEARDEVVAEATVVRVGETVFDATL
jgi:hypothetical protein